MVRDLQGLFLKVFSDHDPTVVMVSHDPEDAARMADRAIVLTGRPARITADVMLSGQRGQRSAADIARLAAHLAEAGSPVGASP
jgi:NitT/TauT family transport system ATP-binding protein/sulfonate transport system ATP-binding protein